MPDDDHDDFQACVQEHKEMGHDMSTAHALCAAETAAKELNVDDDQAFKAVAVKKATGSWPSIHPAEKTSEGRERLLETYAGKVEQSGVDKIDARDSSVKFKARMTGPSTIMKVSGEDEDRFVIWGKASVEVVDKEGDIITADALKEALPQLLRRKRLSVEHSDQLVGDILESFETDKAVTVEVDGKEYTRKDFPTDVLQLDDEEPALFVAGEIYDDSRQAQSVREDIEAGKIDSYSISGEAISTSTKVKDGQVYDEINEMDLSAVTLCEEGMNQKAKFGTVVKIGGDDSVRPGTSGRTSSPAVAVVKSNPQTMSDSAEAESGDDGDLLTREDLRGEFKNAAQEALKDADFVTADEVKSMIENAVHEDEDDEEAEAPEEPEEKGEEEDEAPDAHADVDPEGEDAPEDPGSDDEEATEPNPHDDLDPEGGDAPDDEDGEARDFDSEEKGDLVAQLEEKGVPDDLVDAVKEYVEDDDEVPVEPELPEDEDEELDVEGDEDEEIELEDDSGDDIGKAATDQDYLTQLASGSVPSVEDDDVEKSFEGDVDLDGDDEHHILNDFYKSVGEEPV